MSFYEPVFDGSGIYSGNVGKNQPAMGPWKNFKPNIIGPGSGKLKAVYRIGQYVAGQFRGNPRFTARVTAVGTGAAIKALSGGKVNGPSNGSFNQAYSLGYANKRKRNKHYNKPNIRGCCCCGQEHRTRGRRRRYN